MVSGGRPEEAKLNEIVRLVGVDSLEYSDRLKLECARSIREDYLHQIAFHEVDTYTSLNKQFKMLKAIITWYNSACKALANNVAYNKIMQMEVIEKIGRMKYIKEEDFDKEAALVFDEINKEFDALEKGDQD